MEGSLVSENDHLVGCVAPSSRQMGRWGFLWIPALFVGLVPISFQVLVVTPVGNYFPSGFPMLFHILSFLFVFLTFFSILLSLCTLLCAIISKDTTKVLSRCVVSAALVVSMFASTIGGTEVHLRALERLSRDGMEVVHAVIEYEKRNGRLPKSIHDLVPSVLAEISKTGFPAYPDYEIVHFSGQRIQSWGKSMDPDSPIYEYAYFPSIHLLSKKELQRDQHNGVCRRRLVLCG